MLVLKRRGRTRLQTGMVEFIALPFQSEKKKLEILSFHVVVVQGAGCRVQGAGCRVQGAGCRVQSCCFVVSELKTCSAVQQD